MRPADIIELENRYTARNYSPANVVITRGKGVWVWDMEGTRYLDCVSGFGAVNQGHCNPKIHKALTEQTEKLTLISGAFRTELLGRFSQEVCDITGSDRVLFMNSGVEAVESAIKVVRKWGYTVKGVPHDKAEIIVCTNNFHGRTIAVIGFSTMEKCRSGFGPFVPGFKVIPYDDSNALEEAITENTVGFLFEPIQGEGGMNIPASGFMKAVREICDRHNILMVCDEIQTGLGRTGFLMAEDYDGVKADISIIGKSLGGGYMPVSAVLSRKGYLEVLQPGEHGSTFGGNPLACAVGRAALKVILEDGLVQNSAEKGSYIKQEIEKMNLPGLKRIKGRGLMMGLEFEGKVDTIIKDMIANGLLCNKAGANVVRLTPPLLISEEEANWLLERLSQVFARESIS